MNAIDIQNKLLEKTIYIIDDSNHRLSHLNHFIQSINYRYPLEYKINVIENIAYIEPISFQNNNIIGIDIYDKIIEDIELEEEVNTARIYLDEFNKTWFIDYDRAIKVRDSINLISKVYCESYNNLYNKYNSLKNKMEALDDKFLKDINNLQFNEE